MNVFHVVVLPAYIRISAGKFRNRNDSRASRSVIETSQSHEDRNERPMPPTVATELCAISDILEKSGARDWIDEESIEALAKPWVTETWTKVCKKSIGVRQAIPLVGKKVTLVGDYELCWRGYNAASL